MDEKTDKNTKIAIIASIATFLSVLTLFGLVVFLSDAESDDAEVAVDLRGRSLSELSNSAGAQGQVAGTQTVPHIDNAEAAARSRVVAWLSGARADTGASVAHREQTLDHRAQTAANNRARTCREPTDSEWRASIEGRLLDEGRVVSADRIFFEPTGGQATEIAFSPASLVRLFSDYDAYGVGVADARGNCDFNQAVVFYTATLR